MGRGTVHMEPFGPPFPLQTRGGLQIGVEIAVGEILPGAVLEHGVVLPGQIKLDTGGVGLLLNALENGLLLSVADFCPALVIRNAGGVVGVNLGDNMGEGLNFRFHHVISFTWLSIKWMNSG